jgi:tetratricopeptide (TPR) repeat protein
MAAGPMSAALTTTNASVISTEAFPALTPWRDPHSVPPEDLAAYIQQLEWRCAAEPRAPELRICLGMAYAMNFQVDKSMDSLEKAVDLDPQSFWAQLKFAELHYRLRVLNRAEEETLKALTLANNGWQLSLARKQLQEIRSLKQGCVRNVEWTKPLTLPALVLSLMLLVIFVVGMAWK